MDAVKVAEKPVSLDDCGLQPMGSRLLVRIDKPKEKTEGGIWLPEASKVRPRAGVVVGVGEGRYLENGTLVKPDFRVGDRIRFSAYAGMDVEMTGDNPRELEEDLKVIDESDVYCKEYQ